MLFLDLEDSVTAMPNRFLPLCIKAVLGFW